MKFKLGNDCFDFHKLTFLTEFQFLKKSWFLLHKYICFFKKNLEFKNFVHWKNLCQNDNKNHF